MTDSQADKAALKAIQETIREVTVYSENKPTTPGGIVGFLRSELFFLGDRLKAEYSIHSVHEHDGSTTLTTSFFHGPEINVSAKGKVKLNGEAMSPSAAFKRAGKQIITLMNNSVAPKQIKSAGM